MSSASYICGDMFAREGDDNFQITLATAYEKSISPQCMCKPDSQGVGITCYIAKLSSTKSKTGVVLYIVKKMPETGHLHSPTCTHYQIPESLSGKASLSENTIQEDVDSGFTTIKTSVSFTSKKPSNTTNNPIGDIERVSNQSVGLRKSQLTLLGILHYLFDSTRLNRWSPRMTGKRHYSLIRHLLTKQAANTIAKRDQLDERLFIPPVYSDERSEQNDNEMQSFIDSLAANNSESPVGIVIGQFKSFGQRYNNATMSLKHVNFDFNINIGTIDVVKRLEKKYRALFDVADVYQYPVFIIAAVINRAGVLFANNLDFQLLTPEFLPIESSDCQRRLIEQLIAENRYFSVPLRFNMNNNLLLAASIIEDSDEPIPLFFNSASTEDSDKENIETEDNLPELAIQLEPGHRKWKLPFPKTSNQER